MCHLLGGSSVAINGVVIPLICVAALVILLIAPLITTHEPPSRVQGFYPPSRGSLFGASLHPAKHSVHIDIHPKPWTLNAHKLRLFCKRSASLLKFS